MHAVLSLRAWQETLSARRPHSLPLNFIWLSKCVGQWRCQLLWSYGIGNRSMSMEHWCSDTDRENSNLREKLVPVSLWVAWDSAVGTVTGYRLDGPWIECRWCRDFPRLSRPPLGAAQPPVQWVPRLFPVVKRLGCGVDHPPLEVYLKSRSGSSWPVLGCILSLISQPLCNRRLSRLACAWHGTKCK